MDKEPSSLNSRNTKKWTRRRLMREAAAAGFTSAAALSLTAEDVKAADSDQITVALDTEGNSKIQVDADWYDRYTHARDIRNKISNVHIAKNAVIRIGLAPGGDGDNPHVMVTLDKNDKDKEKRRSEIPERKDGVRVDVEDGPRSELRCDDLERGDPLPGGAEVVDDDTFCTNGSEFVTGSFHSYGLGWSTAAHCISGCKEGDLNFPDSVTHKGNKIGEVVFIDREMDIAYIEATESYDTKSEVVRPNSSWESAPIHGTLTETAMADLKGYGLKMWGVGSCEVTGNMMQLNVETSPSNFECGDTMTDQVSIDTDNPTYDGDSGAVWFMQNAPDGNNYVAGSMSSSVDYLTRPLGWVSWATQGFSVRDKHNMWWADF